MLDLVLIFFPVAYLLRRGKAPLKELGFISAGIRKDLLRSAVLFALVLVLALAIVWVADYLAVGDTQKVADTILGIAVLQPALLVYVAVARPFSEEVFFRGFLTPRIGIWGQAALFGLLHAAYGSILEVFGAFVLGAVLGAAFVRNNSIMPNILAHWGYNLVSLWMVMV